MSKRESGLYWVFDWDSEEWTIAQFTASDGAKPGFWTMFGNNWEWRDDRFDEIDERRIVREGSGE